MSILPRSLFGRNLLLITGLLIASLLCSMLVFYQLVQRPRIEQLAAFTASYVEALDVALAELPPAERETHIARLNADDGAHVQQQAPDQTSALEPVLWQVRIYMAALRARLGNAAEVRWVHGPYGQNSQVWVHRHYWYGIATDRVLVQFSGLWLALSALLLLLALLGAALIQVRINRPLRQLAVAAQQVGSGQLQSPLAEDGPIEIATVSRSFNGMAQNLARVDADRALMLAGISHDLRTPLTKLRLGIALKDAAVRGSEQDAALTASMERCIEDMDRIIGQFIDFARTNHAMENSEPLTALDINALIRELAQAYAEQGQPFDLQLQALPLLKLRPVALRRLLANLMENAVRHGGRGLEVQTSVTDYKAEVRVLDRGPGVPPESLSQLTLAFMRVDEARSKSSGTGLGLAIAARIATEHGGALSIHLRPEGGLEARLVLPAESAGS